MLIVVAKVKSFIKENKKMNTSADALTVLSEHIENVLVRAMVFAEKDGRKTVMNRDIQMVIENKE